MILSGSSGASPSVPTRIGTPIASAASLIRAAASGLRSGSMSDAFSGHTTRSGRGRPAGGDPVGQVEGAVDVVVEHGPALRVEVEAEPRHVALHDRDGHRRVPPGAVVGTARPATTTSARGAGQGRAAVTS